MLFSSDRGGMRIEYAKHKMGENQALLINANNNLINNCNNLVTNCANNTSHNQLVNTIACNATHTSGNNLNHHLNSVPCTVNNHVNHVNNHINHAKEANQTNSINNNSMPAGANVSIVNCVGSSPATQLTNQQSPQAQPPQANGVITATPILSSTNEPMEIVSAAGIEQCQYMLVNYANRLILI